MMNSNFIASDSFGLDDFHDIEKFVDKFPDFQPVMLTDEQQLKLLLELMGVEDFNSRTITGSAFSKYWDLSDIRLPEFNEEQFDQFYNKWLDISGRDNDMNEYGSLIFLQGLSYEWNQLKHRFIVEES